jgi:hypothetical protein
MSGATVVVLRLLELGASLGLESTLPDQPPGQTALAKAAGADRLPLVRRLVIEMQARGTQVGHLDPSLYPAPPWGVDLWLHQGPERGAVGPLHTAARGSQDPLMFQFLLQKGYDPAARDVKGFTALHHAMR